MQAYREYINQLAEGRVGRVFLNSDKEHALAVLVELIKDAQEELRIFAGCLCDAVGNEPEYIEALSDFIERGGRVRILLNAFDRDKVLKDSVEDLLKVNALSDKLQLDQH